MTQFEWIVIVLSSFSVLLIPAIALMINLVIKWTRSEARLTELGHDIRELVEAKEKVHSEMYSQMRMDRDTTDKRLRWLEENVWKSGGKSGRLRSSSES